MILHFSVLKMIQNKYTTAVINRDTTSRRTHIYHQSMINYDVTNAAWDEMPTP